MNRKELPTELKEKKGREENSWISCRGQLNSCCEKKVLRNEKFLLVNTSKLAH